MKVKNVIIINDFDFAQGGASTVAIDTANALVDAGYNVTFFSVVHNENSSLDERVNRVCLYGEEAFHYDNKVIGFVKGIKNKECGKALEKLLKNYSNKDTIVHVHGWTKACSSIVFNVLEMNNFKIFLTLHDYFSVCPNGAFLNFKSNKCCLLKACSFKCLMTNCDSRNYIFKLYRFIREKQYYKDIHLEKFNLIFVSDLQRQLICEQKEISKNSCIICSPIEELDRSYQSKKLYDYVYVGRDSTEKGTDLFIELANVLSEYNFLFVGDYKRNKPKNLNVTGWVTELEVEHYLKQSRCLIVPSLLPEPFGLVVVKAISFGLTCVVSDNIGARDYINDNTGLTFIQGDVNDLVSKAQQALDIRPEKFENVLVSKRNYVDKIIEFYKKAE